MTASTFTASIHGTKFFANNGGCLKKLYFGLRLTLPRTFKSVKEIHNYIQDEYFDNLGGSGFFWIMPESFKDQITKDFEQKITVDQSAAVTYNEDNTVVELLLMACDYEDIEEELEAISGEINQFIKHGFASVCEQFWLH